jgi:hypothetical protein
MSLLIDSPSGGRPPKLKGVIAKGFVLLLLGVPVYVLMVWWRGREDRQDVIPEPSARAQVEASHGRERVVA